VRRDISIRDGIGIPAAGGGAVAGFPVTSIRKSGRDVRLAKAGDTVQLELPGDAPIPRPGTEIRHLSSRYLDLPVPKEGAFPAYVISREIGVRLDARGTMVLQAAGLPAFSTVVPVEKAKQRRPFIAILEEILLETGASIFQPSAVTFENSSGLADDGIFVPPSRLKKAKNDFYAHLDSELAEQTSRRVDGAPPRSFRPSNAALPADLHALVSQRQRLSPPSRAPVTFVDPDPTRLDAAGLASFGGRLWLPLPPVLLDDTGWEERLRAAASEAAAGGACLMIGLNNLSHVSLARALDDEDRACFFVDFYLYAANARTVALLREKVPRLSFAYAWIEGSAVDARLLADESAELPVLPVAADFSPPLFYSLGCFARHVLSSGSCPEDCPRDFTREIRQGRNRFQAVVRDCVTWVFKL
jgi:hypothetical protein